MNAIWVLLVVASILAALATGGLEAVTQALFEGAKAAVEISLFLLGSFPSGSASPGSSRNPG
jgi:spore maturation protein A